MKEETLCPTCEYHNNIYKEDMCRTCYIDYIETERDHLWGKIENINSDVLPLVASLLENEREYVRLEN